jgi:hypothetical protein
MRARSAGTPGRLRVAVDAEPLYGHETGVGNFCRGLLSALAASDALDLSAFAVTWRRQDQLVTLVPTGVTVRGRPMPARPLRGAWRRSNFPPIDLFLGPVDVVHGTNFVVPPTSTAARVVTVHDLVPVHFPEMCDHATINYPGLIRRALDGGAWVHTHSRFVAAEVVDEFKVDPARVRAIPSGIPDLDGHLGPGGAGLAAGSLPPASTGTSCRSVPSSPARTMPAWCEPSIRSHPTSPIWAWSSSERTGGKRARSLAPWGCPVTGTVSCGPAISTTRSWLAGYAAQPFWPTRRATKGSGTPRCKRWPRVCPS